MSETETMDVEHGTPRHGAVIDIGGSRMNDDLSKRLMEILEAPYSETAKPVLPDELLYDDVGLPIWNEIIFTPEFYQTQDEAVLFDEHGADIAARVQSGITVVDLGAGLVSISSSHHTHLLTHTFPPTLSTPHHYAHPPLQANRYIRTD